MQAKATRVDRLDLRVKLILALTLMATGRAMTLAFIGRAGDGRAGDPPAAWLMPLLGDAAVGLLAPVVAYLLWKRPAPASWLAAVVWGVVAVFDAVAAFVVETSVPWPEFFMLEVFGRSMFFLAIGMHLVALALLATKDVMRHFEVDLSPSAHNASITR